MRIFYWSNGYIRNIIKSVANNIIQIGQDGTSIWNTIDLIPGAAGKVRIYSDDPDSGSALLTATFDDGNLGIGESSPSRKLHIKKEVAGGTGTLDDVDYEGAFIYTHSYGNTITNTKSIGLYIKNAHNRLLLYCDILFLL